MFLLIFYFGRWENDFGRAVDKIILVGGKIILEGGKYILAVGKATSRAKHRMAQSKNLRCFLLPDWPARA